MNKLSNGVKVGKNTYPPFQCNIKVNFFTSFMEGIRDFDEKPFHIDYPIGIFSFQRNLIITETYI
jgi:hypothetical protein